MVTFSFEFWLYLFAVGDWFWRAPGSIRAGVFFCPLRKLKNQLHARISDSTPHAGSPSSHRHYTWASKPQAPGRGDWYLSWGICHVTRVLTTLLLCSLLSLRICGFLVSYQLSHALKRLATIYLPLNVYIRMVFKLCNPKYYQNLPAMTYSLLFHAFLHVFLQPRVHSLFSCQENCIPSSRSSSSVTSTINHLLTTSSCFPSLKSFPLSTWHDGFG